MAAALEEERFHRLVQTACEQYNSNQMARQFAVPAYPLPEVQLANLPRIPTPYPYEQLVQAHSPYSSADSYAPDDVRVPSHGVEIPGLEKEDEHYDRYPHSTIKRSGSGGKVAW